MLSVSLDDAFDLLAIHAATLLFAAMLAPFRRRRLLTDAADAAGAPCALPPADAYATRYAS